MKVVWPAIAKGCTPLIQMGMQQGLPSAAVYVKGQPCYCRTLCKATVD